MSKQQPHRKAPQDKWPLSHFDVPTATGQVSSADYAATGPDATKHTPPPVKLPAPANWRQDGATQDDLQPGVVKSPGAGRPGNTDARPKLPPTRGRR